MNFKTESHKFLMPHTQTDRPRSLW